jgi:hypothetical protein
VDVTERSRHVAALLDDLATMAVKFGLGHRDARGSELDDDWTVTSYARFGSAQTIESLGGIGMSTMFSTSNLAGCNQ